MLLFEKQETGNSQPVNVRAAAGVKWKLTLTTPKCHRYSFSDRHESYFQTPWHVSIVRKNDSKKRMTDNTPKTVPIKPHPYHCSQVHFLQIASESYFNNQECFWSHLFHDEVFIFVEPADISIRANPAVQLFRHPYCSTESIFANIQEPHTIRQFSQVDCA